MGEVAEGPGVGDALAPPEPPQDVDVVGQPGVADHLESGAGQPAGVAPPEAEDEAGPEGGLQRGRHAGHVQGMAGRGGDDAGGDLDPLRAGGDGAQDDGRLLQVPALREEHPAEADPFGVDTVLDALGRRSGIGLVPAGPALGDHATADDVGAQVGQHRFDGSVGRRGGERHRVAKASSSAAWVRVRRIERVGEPAGVAAAELHLAQHGDPRGDRVEQALAVVEAALLQVVADNPPVLQPGVVAPTSRSQHSRSASVAMLPESR